MLTTDVLIVGAGPAGATTSLFLASKGIAHTIVDRAVFPRDKVDGNAFSYKVLNVLEALGGSLKQQFLASPHLLQCSGEAQIFAPNLMKHRFSLPCDKQVAPILTMSRVHFDNFLVKNLDSNYANVQLGTEIEDIVRVNNELEVTITQNGLTSKLRTKLIVGADGERSIVLRKLAHKQKAPQKSAQTIHAYFQGLKGFEKNQNIEAHFIKPLLPNFLYITPLADGTYKVGLGMRSDILDRSNLDLEQVLFDTISNNYNSNLASCFEGATLTGKIEHWPMSFGEPRKQVLSGHNYLLVGDAASLCNPLTGFGTGNAMISGKIAAEFLQKALLCGQFDRSVLAGYDQEIFKTFQREFKFGYWMKRLASYPWFINYLTTNIQIRKFIKNLFPSHLSQIKQV
ncbi:MAG: NAD(P)/FAD-dependent oxidoreductase [Rivularia sp. (in: cyanobacteria)]